MPQRFKILNPTESYTFSKYFDLPYTAEDILGDLGCTLVTQTLNLPQAQLDRTITDPVRTTIEQNLNIVTLSSEMARREAVIAPIVLAVCKHIQAKLRIEYTLKVNEWLKGTLDYYIKNRNRLIVIEAKQADLTRGFTQLAVELIALDQWEDADNPIYGAVTSGDIWKFGAFDRTTKTVHEDRSLYLIPKDIETLMSILVGITAS
jgi:hypothetical protein